MLIFFTTLALVIFSSLMYYAERGTYDVDVRAWKRLVGFECNVSVKVLEPEEWAVATDARSNYTTAANKWLDQLLRTELAGSECETSDMNDLSRDFTCIYAYGFGYETEAQLEYSGSVIQYVTRKGPCHALYE
eukprot:scaffold386394_cov48-Prasinocladus_malaysianus.AAC.1